MKSPKIVPVPEKMEKYFGRGTMLHPDIQMIEGLIEKIPKGKITTINSLAKRLSDDFETDVTCPMRTGNHLKKLSKIPSKLPFWRVIRTDGKMIKLDNYEHWATILEKEGFKLQFTKSYEIKVLAQDNQIFQFD